MQSSVAALSVGGAALFMFERLHRSILYDNMKQVKLSAFQWNEQFLDFTNYWGIVAMDCRCRTISLTLVRRRTLQR